MHWDWQGTDEQDLWHHMGPVNQLMSGIPLDDEFWQAMPPIVSTNKAVEVLYLRNYVTDNYRAVGAVSNRTYNYYTQATDSLCSVISDELDLPENAVYLDPQDFVHPIGTETLIIPNMGDQVEYNVNWYNALTGTPLGTGMNSSDEDGNLPLYFPLVSGDETRPILFFEIYRTDQANFKSASQDTEITDYEIIDLELNLDSVNVLITNWDRTTTGDIQLYPNPTSNFIHVKVYSDLFIGSKWEIFNSQGQLVQTGVVHNYNTFINLADYKSGIYIFRVFTNNISYEFKIIKS